MFSDFTWLPTWNGFPLVPTDHALVKMDKYDMQLYDIKNILEYSFDCGEKRTNDVFEKCERWRNRNIKIVVVKAYSGWVKGDAWIIKTVLNVSGKRNEKKSM